MLFRVLLNPAQALSHGNALTALTACLWNLWFSF